MADARTHDRNGRTVPEGREDAGGVAARLTDWAFAAPLRVKVLLSLLLLGLVALLDIATGEELSFSIFYLVPVSYAGASISRRAGFALAVLSSATWGYLEVAMGRPYSAAWIPYWNTGVRLGVFVLVNELIDRLRRAHAAQHALASQDSLTGIANARVFHEYADRALATSRRTGRPFTVAYVDLDRFKQVNDTLGHSEGDRLLRTVARLLADQVRSTDVVARLGGDEFGLLMPETDRAAATVSLERIAAAFARDVGARWTVGATIGAITFVEAPLDVDAAVHEADALMYQGKAEGRGRIVQATWPGPAAGSGETPGGPTAAPI